MTIGTRSVLYGAHCFFLHPWFVAVAWWRLYGFPWDPRLWVAFFVHDLGYIGKPNMDGPEGEQHPRLGAAIMRRLFDGAAPPASHGRWIHERDEDGAFWRVRWSEPDGRGRYLWVGHYAVGVNSDGWCELAAQRDAERRNEAGRVPWEFPDWRPAPLLGRWEQFVLLHSRYFAKSLGLQPSRLCVADKLALALTPAWLYLPMVRVTGEIHEYMAHARHRIKGNEAVSDDEKRRLTSGQQREWYSGVQSYMVRWVDAHKGGARDTWTSDARQRATVNENGVWQ